MSSRFVPAGSDQAPVSGDHDSWGKARQEVETQRNVRPVEPGQQEGGKSLYEVLQANKAAKQEAFEEATKLRNQFRTLDDSEIEFLDSIRESERAKEDVVRKETADQLDLFRKQRSDAEQAVIDNSDISGIAQQQQPLRNTWTTSKKRRRDKSEEDTSSKQRKSTVNEQDPPTDINGTTGTNGTPVAASHMKEKLATTITKDEKIGGSDRTSTGLGLSAYDSDDDDDD